MYGDTFHYLVFIEIWQHRHLQYQRTTFPGHPFRQTVNVNSASCVEFSADQEYMWWLIKKVYGHWVIDNAQFAVSFLCNNLASFAI